MTQTENPNGSDINSSELAHIPLLVRQNSLNWTGRSRRTHTDAWRTKRFREKELAEQLEENFKIRQRNKNRRKQDDLHVEHTGENDRPRPGSPQASEWSISDENWEILKDTPDTYEAVKQWLTAQKRHEIEKAHRDRTAPPAPSAPPAPLNTVEKAKDNKISLKAKRFVEKPHRLGMKTPPVFHPSLLQWANYHDKTPAPLAMFLTDNLKKLNNDSSRELKKHSLSDGTSPRILDMAAFCKRHGISQDDTTLEYTETIEALENWVTFEEERDPDGAEGDYAMFALQHAGFFDAQRDKVKLHYLWKEQERELRKRRFEEQVAFDATYYDNRWSFCLLEHKQDGKRNRDDEERRKAGERDPKKRRMEEPVKKRGEDDPDSGDSANQHGGQAPYCLGCARRGHKSVEHDAEDGEVLWAKLENGRLLHPTSGTAICTKFNIHGQESCRPNCRFEHVCSFCGDSSHYALSWQCTAAQPTRYD
ncbi:hypothetical protein V5O48_009247 [Marasmius crinis-equi]|uniref:C3H1-type domain-containing protein n=1 Tax=Marasmius crinis-equi TaxID=585013 RepID=A0ABR3FBN6_9AGAR